MLRHMPIVGLERQPLRLPLDQASRSSCTRHSPRAGTRWPPSPSARRRGSRRPPGVSRWIVSACAVSSPIVEVARARDPARLPLVVLADVDQLDRPLPLQLGHPLGLDIHRPDGTVRGRGVGQLVRLAARHAGAVRAAALPRTSWRRRSSTAPGPIRVAGAGHSFSAGAVTDGTLIWLDALHRVLDADAPRARPRRGGHPPESVLARAARARAGDAQPRRHRRPVARGRARHRHARHGHAAPEPLRARSTSVELVLADGSERTIDGGDELLAARVSLGRARRHRRGHAPLCARVPPASHRQAGAARAGARRRCRRAPTPTTTSSSGPSRTPTSRSPARSTAPRTRRTSPAARAPTSSDVLMDNHAFRAVNEVAKRFPGTIPRLNRFASAVASQRERVDWSLRRSSPPTGSCASRRWSTRPARARGRRRARRPRRARAPRGQLPDRAALHAPPTTRCSRPPTAATARSSPSTSSRAWPYEPAFREVEAALSELGGRPHWGKRSFLDRTQLAPRYPRWDDFQRDPRTSSTRAGASPTPGSATCWDERDEDVQHLRRRRSSTTPRTPTATTRGMDRFGPKIGADEDRRLGLRAAARPGAVPVPLRVRRGVDHRPRGQRQRPPSRRAPTCSTPGDAAAFPVGPAGAHKVFNASERDRAAS